MVQLTVVVPTFNEATNILDLLAELEQALAGRDYEIVLVDDNSPDGTFAKVDAYAKDHPRIVPVLRVTEKGLATAVIAGLTKARGEYVVVMDSDFQHPPSTVPRLLEAAIQERADCVVASRYAPGGSVTGFPVVRRIISWGARMLAVWGLPVVRHNKVRDPMSGFFLVRKDRVHVEALRPRGYKILLEVLAKSDLRRVAEVGFAFQNRRAGESKLKAKTQVDYFFHVTRLALQDRENRRLATFSLVGLSGIVVNLLVLSLLLDLGHWDDLWRPTIRGQTFLLGTLAAAVVSREAAIVWNFAWNDHVTFHDKRALAHAGYFHRLFRFHIVSIWSFLVYLAIFYPLVHVGVHYLPASFLAILAGFLLNYAGNMKWTYARRREPHEE